MTIFNVGESFLSICFLVCFAFLFESFSKANSLERFFCAVLELCSVGVSKSSISISVDGHIGHNFRGLTISCNGQYACRLNIRAVSKDLEVEGRFEESLEEGGTKKGLQSI